MQVAHKVEELPCFVFGFCLGVSVIAIMVIVLASFCPRSSVDQSKVFLQPRSGVQIPPRVLGIL